MHHFTANVGGGYTSVVGGIGDRLDGGGNFQAAAGFNFNRYLGVLGTFSFNQLGVTRSALDNLNVPDGNGRVYTFTVDPKFTLPLRGRASVYVLGGGGWLRRTVQFTQPTVAQTIVFDPWWGYFGPALVPANQVLGTVSQNAGVWDVGAGVNIPLPRTNMKLYVESRYYDGLTDRTHTTVVPITVGLRW
ncbi:MAG TPA: outer membrane beta-barrel protein [Bryobacteraceae bacterium]|nr:outer membrane beta-barrel protein [Bryobacteraceae bacterium]